MDPLIRAGHARPLCLPRSRPRCLRRQLLGPHRRRRYAGPRSPALQPAGAPPRSADLLGQRREPERDARPGRDPRAPLLWDRCALDRGRPLHPRLRHRHAAHPRRARGLHSQRSPDRRGGERARSRGAHLGDHGSVDAHPSAPGLRAADARGGRAHRSALRAAGGDGRARLGPPRRPPLALALSPQLGRVVPLVGRREQPRVLGDRGCARSAGRRVPRGHAGERWLLRDHRGTAGRGGAHLALHRGA